MEWLNIPTLRPEDSCSVNICWAREDTTDDPCGVQWCATRYCLIKDGLP
jgi:hypothetical protein